MKAFACLAIASAVSALQLQSQNPATSYQMAQVQGGEYWDALTVDTAKLMAEKDADTVESMAAELHRYATEDAHYLGLSEDELWERVQSEYTWYKFDCVDKIPAFLTDIYSHYYVVEDPSVNYLCTRGGYTYDNSDFWAMMQDLYETLDNQYAAAAQKIAVQGALDEQGQKIDAVIDALEARLPGIGNDISSKLA